MSSTIDNLVQLEEDFNGQKTVGKHWKTAKNIGKHLKSSDIILRTTEDPSQIIQFSLKRISTVGKHRRKTVGKHRKTAENIGKHLKSSDIILRTTEDPSQKIQFSLKRISTVGPKSGWGGVVRLSQTSPIPRSPDGDNKRHTLTLNFQMKQKSCYSWFPNGLQYSLRGLIWSKLISNRSILILPHFIEGAPQKLRTGGGYALHRERFYNSYNPAENIGKQLRTSENT